MGLYQHMRSLWRNPTKEYSELMRQRRIQWGQEPVTIRIARPTRLDRARSLGYKAKPGFVVARQRLMRGGRQRPKIRSGRRPRHMRRFMVLDKSYKQVAEERAAKKFPNLEVLNSYFVAKDGKHYWFEVILVDKAHPAVLADKDINWIASRKHTRRVFRGLTSAARRSRGLRKK
jgi:large subunit ribosomal protein L15e